MLNESNRISRRDVFCSFGAIVGGVAIHNGIHIALNGDERKVAAIASLDQLDREVSNIRILVQFPDSDDVKVAQNIIKALPHLDPCTSDFVKSVKPELTPVCEILESQRKADERFQNLVDKANIPARRKDLIWAKFTANLEQVHGAVVAILGGVGIGTSVHYSPMLRRGTMRVMERLAGISRTV